MNRDNYDVHMALLDTALILKKVADVILDGKRGTLAALEDIIKRMDRMEDMPGCGRFQGRGMVDDAIH
ncbi:MAG: hypothetical protein LBE98_04615 [Puniceicoccales bacterium]|jgi:hypothetical protein|nr:hypothetical protein [Puniceicoccales bacterium]